MPLQKEISLEAEKVYSGLESTQFRGREPVDLTELWDRKIFRIRLVRLLATHSIRLSPLNLQKFVGPPKEYTSVMLHLGLGSLNLYDVGREQKYLNRALFCANWVKRGRISSSKHFAIGSGYELQLKLFKQGSEQPSVFYTALCGEFLARLYEVTGDYDYLLLARECAYYLLYELGPMAVAEDRIYFPYTTTLKWLFVPNISARVAQALLAVYKHDSNEDFRGAARRALRMLTVNQREDGSWRYSEESNCIDCFHTGFILEGFLRYMRVGKSEEFRHIFLKGLSFFERFFCWETGRPLHKIMAGRPNNVDSLLTLLDLRDCAQGIILFSEVGDERYFELLEKMIGWARQKFSDGNGQYYYQTIPFYTIKTPYPGNQAFMYYALSVAARHFKGF